MEKQTNKKRVVGGRILVGATAKFPSTCVETGKRIYKGESYYFEVINKKCYHPSSDFVSIYFSNNQNQ
jgi:hypothetical protein